MANNAPASGFFVDRFGFVLLVVSVTVLVLLLADLPRRGTDTTSGEVVVTALTGGTLVLALLASGTGRAVVRLAVIGGGIFVVLGLISLFADVVSVGFFRLLWFFLVVATPFIVLRRLIGHHRVTIETLFGAASVYLLIAVMFMFLYLALDAVEPGQFFGQSEPTTAFMYFSLVTITTLGYGDLAPATELARALSTVTAVVGQIYLVMVVARLVGLYTAGHRQPMPDE